MQTQEHLQEETQTQVLELRIDARESELFKNCEKLIQTTPAYKNIKLTSAALPLGDIIISNGQTDLLVIERKSLLDLNASIKDGRYEEQSYRLNGLPIHNHNIVYLIEGDINKMHGFRGNYNSFKPQIDHKQMLYSAMFSIQFYKGFSLVRSQSMEETATILCNMVYKIVKETKKKMFYISKNNIVNCNELTNNSINDAINNNELTNDNGKTDYVSVIKKVKKDNITKDNIGEIMLCNIPGVSAVTATTIMKKYKTLPNLIAYIQEDETCLNSIMTIDANGKERKISKTTIKNIVDYLKE